MIVNGVVNAMVHASHADSTSATGTSLFLL